MPLLNANNTNNVSDPNLELKYIFVAVTGTTGQIGAGTVTGADTICTNEKIQTLLLCPEMELTIRL
ncbi:hypothetical protein LEP1GSC116_3610 [Leptospira interrogans serovar Icterohaemorrhagiae str. Verdun HP]|uniref:Uncharacterized protein n=1 Tax=Leptospira interrogans serovar Icterohaemorrhagiae str. Verdun HP TaxID=1049910 RepID=M6RCY9_LEPIR|nr:hypothetical protein LEP1GSC116_3610 [Leptospira interrogans serovar Icterohaemorrhagiae str. Verdun HP]